MIFFYEYTLLSGSVLWIGRVHQLHESGKLTKLNDQFGFVVVRNIILRASVLSQRSIYKGHKPLEGVNRTEEG